MGHSAPDLPTSNHPLAPTSEKPDYRRRHAPSREAMETEVDLSILSPVIPNLRRFGGAYSPEHLNLTPRPILIVNNKACSLLGYSSGELCGIRFPDLLRKRNCKAFTLHEPEECDASEDGTIVLLSGKVVELLSKDGRAVQVSLWIRQLDSDGPCLVVAEPVSCKTVMVSHL
ncbi:hypothetical protein MSG28_010787 [Choristoneura fumiferana]|uniref:Uncharacterized protein n=1 Tax=Choristoneura fumiferana TaxID=7141 RepID=A0ACC0KPD1_CHOFU|nr:hypothetical protein MSG28_010787 [Choristoneura fumiferana]